MSATLTPAQRDRLISREVRILRGLILDMVGTLETDGIAQGVANYSAGGRAQAAANRAFAGTLAAIDHASAALGHYVSAVLEQGVIQIWDDGASLVAASTASLAPWRARLAAALALPAPTEAP